MQLNACAISFFLLMYELDLRTTQFLSRPDLFKQIHLHTDVRLALGWSGVFVAGATAFYSWRLEFEQSKPIMWIGLIVCVFLSHVSYWLTVFRLRPGTLSSPSCKRSMRTLSRVTSFLSGNARLLISGCVVGAIPIGGLFDSLGRKRQIVTERITLSSRTKPSNPESPPAYSLSLTYRRSTNGGKSLLSRGEATEYHPYNGFFDEQGILDHDRFEIWVGEVVGRVMAPEWE